MATILRKRRAVAPLAGLALLTVLSLCAFHAQAREAPKSEAPAAAAIGASDCLAARCAVTVSGGRFMRDGRPWIPKGVVITGFVAPEGYIKGTYARAREVWGETLLKDLRSVGVDTLRFNVSVAGLDPQNPMGDGKMTPARKKAYLDDIVGAVNLAQRYGMNSIVTLIVGQPTGFTGSSQVPGPDSVRAWSVLAPPFVGSPSVILNAFNEPVFRGFATVDTDDSPWRRWSAGYQPLVDAIRKTGARNVIMLNGLSNSRVWRKNSDALIPKDPLSQLAYDIHPFPTSSKEEGGNKFDYQRTKDIDYWLDGWCDRHACVASAFFTGVSTGTKTARCFVARNANDDISTPKIAEAFVNHFTRKNIGVMIFAGDWNYRLFDRPGQPGAKLTTYQGFSGCDDGKKNMGPGELMRSVWMGVR